MKSSTVKREAAKIKKKRLEGNTQLLLGYWVNN